MLHLNNLTYRIEGRQILENVSVHVPRGHKVGVVGRNGAGKTTLLRLITGEVHAEQGEINMRRNARMTLVAQEAPGGTASLLATVLAADVEREALLAEAETAEDPGRIADIQERLADINSHGAPARAARVLAGLGFDDDEQQRPCAEFSGGRRMRVGLAAALFSEPDLLLLDEPTNYLDLEGVLWLEQHLQRYRGTVMIVSHDRDLLNNAATAILHIDAGRLTLYRGGYDDFERLRRERQALALKMKSKQDTQRRHMEAFVERFRFKASKAKQAQSRLKALARMEPIASAVEDSSVIFRFPDPADLKSPVIVCEDASVGYGDGPPVLQNLNLRIDADDRIALLGRNGNGKSTLAKLLGGRLKISAGRFRSHKKLNIGFFAQHQIEDLIPNQSGFEQLRDALPQLTQAQVRARLGSFGLAQDKANVTAENLSGGERARLVLALMTVNAPQLLIMDEPTNHLDVDAREALAMALNAFEGAVLLISHDRHLVDLVAERLWLVDGGTVTPYEDDLKAYRRALLDPHKGKKRAAKKNAAKEASKFETAAPSAADSGIVLPTAEAPATDANAAQGRRDARRESADARARLTPLKKVVKRHEKSMEKHATICTELETRLADPKIYEGVSDIPRELQIELGYARKALKDAEEAWLAAEEALDEATKVAG